MNCQVRRDLPTLFRSSNYLNVSGDELVVHLVQFKFALEVSQRRPNAEGALMVCSDICSWTTGDGQRFIQDQDNESKFVPSPRSVDPFWFCFFQMHPAHLALSLHIMETCTADVSKK